MVPGVGASEILVILVVLLLVMGPKNIPRTARLFGRWMRAAQRAVDDLKKDLEL